MKRRSWAALVASAAIVALAATLAVLWPGYDARQVPPDDASVWVLQTGEGKRYARVNSDLGELDTVRDIENPSGIAQYGDTTLVFADGHQRFARVDPAMPQNFDEVHDEFFDDTPAETSQVVTAGEWIAFLTAAGDVYAGKLGEEPQYLGAPDPESAETTQTRAVVTAIGLSVSGEVALLSAEDGTIALVRASDGGAIGEWHLPAERAGRAQLARIGETWVMLDTTSGTLWSEGRDEAIATGLDTASLLQQSSESGNEVIVADPEGLVRVGIDGENFARLTDAAGTPARPVSVGGVTYAAWSEEHQGTLWSSDEGAVALDFRGEHLGDEVQLAFMTNGSRVVLNEQYSGWVWSVPDGSLLPSSQRWTLDERTPQVTESSEVERVLEPKPPVAEDDAFGVRAGRASILPVLLNDHDPNEDVLSVIPESLTGIDAEFGTVTLVNNDQQLVIETSENASGSVRFSYAVTDGTAAGGLHSAPAEVTVSIVPEATNTEPVWCGTDGCLAEWPTLEVAPGDTQSVNVLDGWVDPEGDPLYVLGVAGDVGFGQLVTSPDGLVTYRHPDPSDTEARTLTVDVVVADSRGAQATKPLSLSVTPEPSLSFVSFAVSGAVGTAITIDTADAVRGSTGPATLTSLSLIDDAAPQTTITRSGLTATFTSETPGSYLLQATVSDGASETTGLVRVTVVSREEAQITTVPLTAFVRPGEDATVDVMPAVSDPASDVLLLDALDVRPQGNSELTVDVIGQHYLRVMGDTETGEPGTLGTASYRVSDGSGAANRESRGEVTFVLLPATEAAPPIAVDDRVVVRAGAQIDIPVLDNDTAPAGSHVHIDPSSITNEHGGGLAFATNRLVRYLAPDEPGDYTVTYRTFLLGYPSLTSTARIHITVNDTEDNVAPTAPTLEGRVRSGQAVSIPFDPFGIDADGDVPRLDRILTQPDNGSATISSEGDAVMFTSAPGAVGQSQFSYRVRDSRGMTGVGEVRVGVLDEQAKPSPIVYSDYVQVQRGEGNKVTVSPLDNDSDPGGSTLTVTEVTPNAPPGSREFTQLKERLRHVDRERGLVTIESGEELGTFTYEYTAENERGDSARGLIVVKVVREPVPAYPHVRDTVLNAERLAELEEGVDVISGQVSWHGGDASDLTLDLWGEQPGFSVTGSSIRGSAEKQSRVVPFQVSGTSFSGEEVVSYGFLRVPGTDDLMLSLRSSYAVVEVEERASLDIDLRDAVRVPPGGELEVLASEVRASGARAEATCEVAEDLTVRYSAGSGAPWQDVCNIPVKLQSQEEYTQLALQVRVIARDPQPELRSATITVSPGATQTYDLTKMVEWNGRRERPDVTFDTKYSGAQFEVSRNGTELTIRAHDTAKPSREERVDVTVTHPQGSSSAPLILTVGRSPKTLPKGATVAAECSQADGSTSCLVPVIGQPGEVNPFPETPLTLTSVSRPSNCEGVSMSVEDESRVRVSWRGDLPGAADCRAAFTVVDAQNRSSTGGRAGQLVFDLQGLPANPTRLDWVSYGADRVTLRAVSERPSIPEITGYVISGGGITQSCPATGECTIEHLEAGAETEFRVRAVNSVGTSSGDAKVRAWAYRAPEAPKLVSWEPVAHGTEGGMVALKLDIPDRSTASVTVSGGARPLPVRVDGSSVWIDKYDLGSNQKTTLTVVPETKFRVPPVGNGSSRGTALSITGVHGIGAPGLNVSAQPHTLAGTITVTATIDPKGVSETNLGYWIGEAGERPACTPTAQQRREHTFEGLVPGKTYSVQVCATHRFQGKTGFGTSTWNEDITLGIPAPAPATYRFGATPRSQDGAWIWTDVETDARATEGYVLEYRSEGRASATLEGVLPSPGTDLRPSLTIRNCLTDGSACGPESKLTARGAPVSPKVIFHELVDSGGMCRADDLRAFATVTGVPQSDWIAETLPKDTHAKERFLRVSFPGLGLAPVESPRCTVPSKPEMYENISRPNTDREP